MQFPVRRQISLREQVVEALRHLILYGDLGPGEKIGERQLCEQLEVSRTLVREALQHIESEGLIVNVLHKGFYVASIDKQEMKSIYQVRRALEELVCKLFAQNASEVQMQALSDELDKLKKLVNCSEGNVLLEAKNSFYEVLWEGSGNSEATNMLKNINNRVTQIRRMSMGTKGRFPLTVSELEAVVEMIKKRDGDEAARLCGLHLIHAEAAALSQFDKLKK